MLLRLPRPPNRIENSQAQTLTASKLANWHFQGMGLLASVCPGEKTGDAGEREVYRNHAALERASFE